MRDSRGTVRVHARLEGDGRLPFVADGQLTRYQYHPLGRRVPVLRDHGIGGSLENTSAFALSDHPGELPGRNALA
jgi:hypothetical protein